MYAAVNDTIARPSIYQKESKNSQTNMNSNHSSKNKDYTETESANIMKFTLNCSNYACNDSSNRSDSKVDVIDLSKEVSTLHPVIPSKHPRLSESGGNVTENVDYEILVVIVADQKLMMCGRKTVF